MFLPDGTPLVPGFTHRAEVGLILAQGWAKAAGVSPEEWFLEGLGNTIGSCQDTDDILASFDDEDHDLPAFQAALEKHPVLLGATRRAEVWLQIRRDFMLKSPPPEPAFPAPPTAAEYDAEDARLVKAWEKNRDWIIPDGDNPYHVQARMERAMLLQIGPRKVDRSPPPKRVKVGNVPPFSNNQGRVTRELPDLGLYVVDFGPVWWLPFSVMALPWEGLLPQVP